MKYEKYYVFYKRFALTFIFYIAESAATALLFGFYFYFSGESWRNTGIEEIVFKAVVVFFFRFLLLQAFLELLIVFLIIYFDGWKNFWIVFIGVLTSVILWGLAMGDSPGFEPGYRVLKGALTGYGCLLFSGTLFAWWICYKKIGLKI